MNESEPRLAGLLLAAGGSRRLGEPKQLVTFRQESLVLRAARNLLAVTPVVVAVTGAYAARTAAQINALPLRIVCNTEWQTGMGGSIARGMTEIGDDIDGVLVLLCDQWRVTADDLRGLVRTWRRQPIDPVFSGDGDYRGPPAIFPSRLFARLRTLQGDRGARAVVGDSGFRLFTMENARFDIDTGEDLAGIARADRHPG
jgi:molybdenum cofactor cytidylyltransferase